MVDYQSFSHGSVDFPLAASGDSLLRDADPPMFYLLEFYRAVIEKHVGPRLLAEAIAVGMVDINRAVAETLPIDPEQYVTELQVGFPLLAACRRKTRFDYIGIKKAATSTIDVSYVLPPLTAGYAERLMPVLHAVAACLDSRTERAMDPSYRPTGSSLFGDNVWVLAGVSRAEVKAVAYGGYTSAKGLFLPGVMLTLELQQISDTPPEGFEPFEDVNVHIDVPETAETEELPSVVETTTTLS